MQFLRITGCGGEICLPCCRSPRNCWHATPVWALCRSSRSHWKPPISDARDRPATALAPVRPHGRTCDARRTTDRHARADTNLSHASAKFFLAPQSLQIALSLSVYTRRQALCGPEYPHCRTMGLGPLLRRPRLEWYQRRWIDAREADQPVWVAEDGSLCNAYRVSPLG